jgi:CDP-paratose 2-epimerase
MSICLVTGSSGLVGSESVRFFAHKGFVPVGIDNDMRQKYFGAHATTVWNLEQLKMDIPQYEHHDVDIRDDAKMEAIFAAYGSEISLIIHTAAQPSHDWAANHPMTDFDVNARGTLQLLELARKYCPDTVFIFTSTNKVYGDRPNRLPLQELETRFELDPDNRYYPHGIDESLSIDYSKHSLFGVSKVAADMLVQEYGRYFGLQTVCFRCGCLTGPGHCGTELHGFLAYLMACILSGRRYTIFGYNGKQVRDNMHSSDLVRMFWHFYQKPRAGAVYNAGGGRNSNCSILEAITLIEAISGEKARCAVEATHRNGDHIWWISDMRKFRSDYPDWSPAYSLKQTLEEIYTHRQKNKRIH